MARNIVDLAKYNNYESFASDTHQGLIHYNVSENETEPGAKNLECSANWAKIYEQSKYFWTHT